MRMSYIFPQMDTLMHRPSLRYVLMYLCSNSCVLSCCLSSCVPVTVSIFPKTADQGS